MECWNIERSKRPSFSQLRQIFGEMSMGEIRYEPQVQYLLGLMQNFIYIYTLNLHTCSETFGCTGLGQGENASGAEYISVV